jgi:hypothetical protein
VSLDAGLDEQVFASESKVATEKRDDNPRHSLRIVCEGLVATLLEDVHLRFRKDLALSLGETEGRC